MSTWDIVTSGATNDELTCNFMKNDNSLYETPILSSIESNGPVTSSPNVIAKICNTYFCIAIDRTINIFNDINCSDVLSNVVFESRIDCFCVCQDFIVLGCSDGNIFFLHIPSGGQLVLTHYVENNQNSEKNCFVSIISIKKYEEFLILCRSGNIYSVNCSCLNEIAKLFEQVNETLSESFINKYELECSILFNVHSEIIFAELINNSDIIILQNGKLRVFNTKSQKEIISSYERALFFIVKVERVQNMMLLIALTNCGHLLAIDLYTLHWIVITSKYLIKDFLITQDVHDTINLTLFTKHNEVLIVTFPDFDVKYQFSVSENCFVINSDIYLEEPLFIEGQIKSLDNQFIDTLLIKSITQGSPEYTLKKLLKKEKFIEAELFAKKFMLNIDEVYKTMALNISKRLRVNKISKIDTFDLVNELIRICDLIEDVTFVIDCCTQITVSYFECTQKLLKYARVRLEQITNADLLQKLMSTHAYIVETCLRLETYKLITLYHEYTDDRCDIQGWLEFLRTDMLTIIECYLKKHNFDIACLIWCRFQHYILAKDAINCSRVLLQAVPHISRPEQILPFFKHFLPTVLQYNPNTLSQIIEFVINKIKLLESDYNDVWPEIGIEFSKELLAMLNISEQLMTDNSCVIIQQYANSSAILNQLFYIIQCLEELLVLKQTHKIIIAFDMYLNDNKWKVVINILDRVSPLNIDYLFENFLEQFLRNNKIDSDQLIEEYVQGITYNPSELSCNKASWETRVITLIKHIHDLTTRLQCIIKILKIAPVPWTTPVEQLAHESLHEQHMLIDDIRTEINQVGLKLMIKKSNFRTRIVNNHKQIKQLIYRMLHRGKLTEILDDLRHVAKSNLIDDDDMYYIVLLYFIKTENYTYFVTVLNMLDENAVMSHCEKFLYLIQQKLTFDKTFGENFYEILTVIDTKLHGRHEILVLKNIYLLQKRFKIFIKPEEYENVAKRRSYFQQYFQQKPEKLDAIGEIENLYRENNELCKLLQIPVEEGVLSLINHISMNSKSIVALAKYFLQNLDTETDPINAEIFCSLAIKLLLNDYTENKDNDLVTFSKYGDDITINIMENSKMALKCIHIACARQPHEPSYFEIEHWILIYCELCRLNAIPMLNDGCGRATSIQLYRDKPVGYGVGTAYRYIQEFFVIILKISHFFPDTWFFRYLNRHSIKITNIELESDFKSLVQYLKNLRTSQYDFILFYIISMFRDFLSFINKDLNRLSVPVQDYAQKTTKWMDTCRQLLLRKVISRKRVDYQLAIMLLNELPETEVLKWITYHQKSFNTDYVKLSTICRLGISYSTTHHLPINTIEMLEKILLRTKWADKLSPLISFHVKDFLGDDNFHDLLKQIILAENVPLQLILEFGRDFEWDDERILLEILDVTLLEWKPDIDYSSIKQFKTIVNSKVNVKCRNYLSLETRCIQVIDVVMNKCQKDVILHHLEMVWDIVNYYYYEIYLCILKLYDMLGHKSTNLNDNYLLNFLLNYVRLERPHQYEKDRWNAKFSDTVDVPEIAQYRLPFFIFSGKQHTSDDIQIIRNELNIFTCYKWAEISMFTNLKKDSIYAYAIKQTVTSDLWSKTFGNDLSSKQWILYSKNADILKRIYEIANQIKNIEVAIGALYLVTNNIPPGADRVAAAESCYNLSLKWSKLEESQPCIEKVRKMYEKCCCLHILHRYRLESFQNKINQPDLLLSALYEHPSIVDRVKSATIGGPDINSAAKEIADLYQIDLKKFQTELIEKLFEDNDTYYNNDETFSLNKLIKDTNSDDKLEDNLLRICYVLQSFEINEAIGYLMSIGITPEDLGEDGDNKCTFTNFTLTSYSNLEKGAKVSDRVRYKAIKCLICIADSKTIESISSWTIDVLQQYRRTLWYLIKFEELGISYNTQRLLTCDKFRLVQGLWTTYSNHLTAIPLISSLMLEYNIEDKKLWECLLSKMLQFQMIKELRQLLPRLIFQSLLLSSRIYIQAWQLVIQHSFTETRCPLSETVEKNCIDGLILLMTCPVVLELNISSIIEYCFQIERPQFVAVLLPFVQTDEREKIVKRIFHLKTSTLLNDIEQLSPYGISTTEQAIKILTQFSHEL